MLEASDFVQNLAIGIGTGIFSSAIVSIVFYCLTEYERELEKAKKMIEPLYGLILMNKAKKDFPEADFSELDKSIKIYFNDAYTNFSNFEPQIFKFELKNAICQIYNLLIDGKSHESVKNGNICDLCECIDKQLKIVERCENEFAKGFAKRVFDNKIIEVTFLIFTLIVIIAIII